MFLLLQWAVETPRLSESSLCCPRVYTPSPKNYTSEPRKSYMSPLLILLGTLELPYWVGKLNLPHLPEIHSRLKQTNKNSNMSKGKDQMTNAALSLDWITSPVVPHWQLSSGRAQCAVYQELSRRNTSRYLTDSWLLIGPYLMITVNEGPLWKWFTQGTVVHCSSDPYLWVNYYYYYF